MYDILGSWQWKCQFLKKAKWIKRIKESFAYVFMCVSGWKADGGTGSLQRGISKIKRPQRAVSEKGTAGILIHLIHILKGVFQYVEGKCPTSIYCIQGNIGPRWLSKFYIANYIFVNTTVSWRIQDAIAIVKGLK